MAHQNVVDVIASNVNITSITKAQSIDYISVVVWLLSIVVLAIQTSAIFHSHVVYSSPTGSHSDNRSPNH